MPLERYQTIAPTFIHGLKSADIPEDVMHMARRCLVDTLAIWASGAATEPSRIARDHAVRRYSGDVAMPFDGRGVNPVGYAFAGACTIDAIDGHDGHQPLKHTVNVAPGGKVTFDLTANAPGDWAFHCHLLMHMHAGMFNVVTVRPLEGAAR